MSVLFKGTGVALVTPFDSSGNIDYQALERLLEHTSAGVDYYVVQGTTGESATTTDDEKAQVLSFVKKNNPNHLPIVFGIGGNYTQKILKQIDATDFDGVAGILSVSPYYNKPSQGGIIEHYTLIAEKSPVPIILYNVPGRTSSNITAQTSLELAQHSNISAIKEASGDLVQAMEILSNKPRDFNLISGDDMLTVPLLAIGGIGVISVLANAFPQHFRKIMDAAEQNEFKKATAVSSELLAINPLMYAESNPVGIKQVLQILGVCKNNVRQPLISASAELQNKIRNVLAELQ